MFKKKEEVNQGSVLSEHYVPAVLPKYGFSLDTFIAGDYKLLSDAYLEDLYRACENELSAIIQTSDPFSVGSICDTYIDGQIAHLAASHQEDVAMHGLQCAHITSSHEVHKGVLDRRIDSLTERMDQLRKDIAPIKDRKAQFEITLGRFHIPIGLPATLAAMLVDALLNYSFLQGILLQSAFLLLICVVCLSVMSDGSMYVLGNLLSRKGEKYMSKWLYYVIAGGLIGMFLLSVIAGVMIRIGSMDITYGSINAAGEFVGKYSYSLAEWGVSLVTAFLTTATGLISLAFSVDENAHLAHNCRALEGTLAEADIEYNNLAA